MRSNLTLLQNILRSKKNINIGRVRDYAYSQMENVPTGSAVDVTKVRQGVAKPAQVLHLDSNFERDMVDNFQVVVDSTCHCSMARGSGPKLLIPFLKHLQVERPCDRRDHVPGQMRLEKE